MHALRRIRGEVSQRRARDKPPKGPPQCRSLPRARSRPSPLRTPSIYFPPTGRTPLLAPYGQEWEGPKTPLYLLDPAHGLCYLAPPATRSRLVAHPLAFLDASKPLSRYAGVVDEDLLIALVGSDEAVALLFAELLHRFLARDASPAPRSSFAPPPKAGPTLRVVAKPFFLFGYIVEGKDGYEVERVVAVACRRCSDRKVRHRVGVLQGFRSLG